MELPTALIVSTSPGHAARIVIRQDWATNQQGKETLVANQLLQIGHATWEMGGKI